MKKHLILLATVVCTLQSASLFGASRSVAEGTFLQRMRTDMGNIAHLVQGPIEGKIAALYGCTVPVELISDISDANKLLASDAKKLKHGIARFGQNMAATPARILTSLLMNGMVTALGGLSANPSLTYTGIGLCGLTLQCAELIYNIATYRKTHPGKQQREYYAEFISQANDEEMSEILSQVSGLKRRARLKAFLGLVTTYAAFLFTLPESKAIDSEKATYIVALGSILQSMLSLNMRARCASQMSRGIERGRALEEQKLNYFDGMKSSSRQKQSHRLSS